MFVFKMYFSCIIFIFLFNIMCCFAKERFGFERHLIPCHSTDYICFKRQYQHLRDHVLLGQPELSIETYEPFTFLYGDTGTCVKISGVKDSELVGIDYDGTAREITLQLELPLKIEQVMDTGRCRTMKKGIIGKTENFTGEFKKFTGNASIEVVFPYELKKKRGELYLDLLEENLEMSLDIAEYGDSDDDVIDESFVNSEWAYTVARNFDAAEYIGLPYTDRYRVFAARVPLHRYIMLYPEEDYNDLQFSHDDESLRSMCYKQF